MNITYAKATPTKTTAQPVAWYRRIWPYALLFALVLGACFANDFAFKHVLTTFEYDAWFYRWTSNRVTEFLSTLFHGQLNLSLITDKEFQSRILPDGPAMPLFFGTAAFLLGHVPNVQDWQFVVFLQCIMQAASACLVMAIAQRVLNNRVFAFIAGIIWGIYPPAIISTRIFMTEQLTVFLLLLYAFCITDKKERVASWFVGGLVAGITLVQKVALIPAVAVSALWTLKGSKSWKRSTIAMAAAAFMVVSAWALYTKQVIGQMYVTSQRYSSYNAVIGWDTEADGLNGTNTPLLPLITNEKSLLAGVVAQWTIHTKECALLLARKVTRLFALPYNDFFDSCLGQNAKAIEQWHVALMYLSLIGVISYLGARIAKSVPGDIKSGDACLILIGGHLVYLMFVASGRYALTSVPFWAVFSSFFLMQAWNCFKQTDLPALQSSQRKWLLSYVLIGLIGGVFIVQAQGLTRFGQNKETKHVLASGQIAVKEIEFSPCVPPANAKAAFVFIDADKQIGNAEIEINGHRLGEGFRSLALFDPAIFWGTHSNATLAHACGVEAEDFRQWRGVAFPPSWLNLKGKNTIKVSQRKIAAVIYGDSDPESRTMPDPVMAAGGNMSSDSLDQRMLRVLKSATIKQNSLISNEPKLSDSLRIKIAVLPERAVNTNVLSEPVAEKSVVKPVPINGFDKMLWWKTKDSALVNKYVVRAAKTMGQDVAMPDMASTHARIKLTGEVLATKENSEPGVAVYVYQDLDLSHKGHIALGAVLPGTPDHLVAGKTWKPFVIEGVTPLSGLAKNQVNVALYHGPWLDITNYGADGGQATAAYRNLNVEFTPVNLPVVDVTKLIFY